MSTQTPKEIAEHRARFEMLECLRRTYANDFALTFSRSQILTLLQIAELHIYSSTLEREGTTNSNEDPALPKITEHKYTTHKTYTGPGCALCGRDQSAHTS